MLSVARLADGQEGYYLGAVAAGVEDYYLGSGEAPGYWTGAGARLFGIHGQVDADDLRTVLAGLDPATGEQRTRPGTAKRPRVAGFDLTFSAPKSVSVLYALADGDVSGEVVDAHEAAVAAGLDYLERHATLTRRRAGGVIEHLTGEGLTVAAFRHRTSRAGDPQLHTHCLTANMVRAIDGRWGTLDSKSLYNHARTAGFVYQAVLRSEMTRRVGVRWGAVSNGHAEIAGISPALRREFSQRRAEIEARLAERGQHSAAAAQAATLDTRRAKNYAVEPVALRDQWATRAAALGTTPADLDRLRQHSAAEVAQPDSARITSHLSGPDGLTARNASFDRRDVVRAWSEAIPPGSQISVDDLDHYTDAFLTVPDIVHLAGNGAADDVVRRSDGRLVPAEPDRRRFSTTEMLAVERRVLDDAHNRRHDGIAVVSEAVLTAALARRPELSQEQEAMVTSLTTSGAGVEVVVGKAGTGKTFALAAASTAWTATGHHVTGVALAARAADELATATGIPCTTIAQFLLDADRPEGRLGPRQVVIVDEAGMVDTRRLDRLLTHISDSGAKVVLVGDHHQLPEVDAGGAFRTLATQLDAVELNVNRRQEVAWEREALDQLRSGDVAEAVRRYRDNGRIRSNDCSDDTRDAMVVAWHASLREGQRALMVAVANRDVEDLNQRARALRIDNGDVTGRPLVVDDRRFARGDHILCLRNDRRVGVINSTIGTVEQVDHVGRNLRIRLSDGTPVTLPAGYLEAGHVTHAYATTVHKAQGLTVDRTFVLGDDRLYREAGYVSLSRGRNANHLYVVHHDPDDALEMHPTSTQQREAITEVSAALERSAAKTLATDELEAQPRLPTSLEGVWSEHDALLTRLGPGPSDPGPLVAAAASRLRQHQDQLAATTAQRERAEAATRSSRLLRPQARRHARRDVRRVESLRRHESWLTEQFAAAQQAQADVASAAVERADWEADHRSEIERAGHLTGALRRAEQAAGRTAERDPPQYVEDTIGPAPVGSEERAAWRTAAGAIESYRARWHLSDAAGDEDDLTAACRAKDQAQVAAAVAAVQDQLCISAWEESARVSL